MTPLSYLSNAELDAFEGLYHQFQQDPFSVDQEWRIFFEGFEFSRTDFKQKKSKKSVEVLPMSTAQEQFQKEIAVSNLIGAYRQRGHMFSKTNPVRPRREHEGPILLENFGLSDADMDTKFQVGERIGLGSASLREIHEFLEQTYCGSIGVEYKFMRTIEIIQWLEKKMESCRNTPNFDREERIDLLRKTNEAVAFENFLHTKFLDKKDFRLKEGSQ